MDDNAFFHEATLKICGSLDSEKALWESLMFLRRSMPVTRLSFHVFDFDSGIVETVAFANPKASVALAVKTGLNRAQQAHMIRMGMGHTLRTVASIRKDQVTAPVARQLKIPDGAGMIMKLVLDAQEIGVLVLCSSRNRRFTKEHARCLKLLNEPFAVALTNCLRFRKVMAASDRLADDNRFFQDQLRQGAGQVIIGQDYGLKGVMEMVHQVAPQNSPVLLLGETGVGKELIADAIHAASPRRQHPFIKVNCGAIPDTLVDSELFGHEKGAFTGALARKRGYFERAHGGTIFLDEIGELPLEAQVRMLRILQQKEFERVGGAAPIKIDIRIVAATHRDLAAMTRTGGFREDLYFRLQVFPIVIPPLRQRRRDIPTLVTHFIGKKAREMGRMGLPAPAPGALDDMQAYHWPGNVRELENAVERALILCGDGPLHFGRRWIQEGEDSCPGPQTENHNLDAVISDQIRKVLALTRGRIEGRQGAAELLGLNPGTLRHRMRKLGIPFGRRAGYQD